MSNPLKRFANTIKRLIDVTPDEDAKQADFVVCCLADTGQPDVESLQESCCECQRPVWISKLTRRLSPTAKAICMDCTVKQVEGGHWEDPHIHAAESVVQEAALASWKGDGTEH